MNKEIYFTENYETGGTGGEVSSHMVISVNKLLLYDHRNEVIGEVVFGRNGTLNVEKYSSGPFPAIFYRAYQGESTIGDIHNYKKDYASYTLEMQCRRFE